MKTTSIAVAIFLFISYSPAQLYKGVGFKSGVSLSNQDWDYKELNTNITGSDYQGFNFGIFIEGLNYRFLSSILEISYIRKGMNTNSMSTIVGTNKQGYPIINRFKLKNAFDYISLSFLQKIQYETDLITPYLQIGPRIDFQIYENIEFGSISNEFNKTTWGYSLGGGLVYNNLDNFNILIELTHSPDLSYLYKTELLEISKYSYEVKIGLFFKKMWF